MLVAAMLAVGCSAESAAPATSTATPAAATPSMTKQSPASARTNPTRAAIPPADTPSPVPPKKAPHQRPTQVPKTAPHPAPRPASKPVGRGSPVIVIDPGHSGKTIRSIDRKTGLRDIDYPNYPEIYEVFDVSTCVAQALSSDGYLVKLTKRHALSSVGHVERAAVANRSKADLAISVHDDHGVSARFEATYDQRGVRRRNGSYPAMYRGEGSHRTVYTNSAVARRSQNYARIIARARTNAQHRAVSVAQNSFNGRAPLERGNLALVQLFSDVPWVYNEMGALTQGSPRRAMSIDSERSYAAGLLAGVEAAVPLRPGKANPETHSAAALEGCLVKRVEPQQGAFTRPHAYLPYRFG
jgi:N-acetylmuramoyl-L-alanine amidase